MNTVKNEKLIKDPKKFILRVVSGVFLFLFSLFLLLYNWNLFVIFVVIIQLIAIYEVITIFSKRYYIDKFFLFFIALYLDILIYFFSFNILGIFNIFEFNSNIFVLFLFSIFFIFLVFSINFIVYLQNNLKESYKKFDKEEKNILEFIKSNNDVYNYFISSLGINFIILFYVVIPFALVIFISSLKKGDLLMLVVFTNFFNDIFAYFMGKVFGSRKFFEFISPNKTLEGFIGGVVGGVLGGLFWAYFSNLYLVLDLYKLVVLIILVSLMAPFGDLFASFIKRSFELKEVSNVIPGHGGVLDRFDSFIFSIYVFSFIFFLFFNL